MNIEDLTLKQIRELGTFMGAPGGQLAQPHPMLGQHCVVRTYTAGVHIGTVAEVRGKEVLLKDARRLWKWEGAFTLSEVANNGIAANSRMAQTVPQIYLTDMAELIPTTSKARATYEACHE